MRPCRDSPDEDQDENDDQNRRQRHVYPPCAQIDFIMQQLRSWFRERFAPQGICAQRRARW
jgi:hypothetical protein